MSFPLGYSFLNYLIIYLFIYLFIYLVYDELEPILHYTTVTGTVTWPLAASGFSLRG